MPVHGRQLQCIQNAAPDTEIRIRVDTNPYRLAEDIEGIGFKRADELAARIGIHTDSDFRIRSGILYTCLLYTSSCV